VSLARGKTVRLWTGGKFIYSAINDPNTFVRIMSVVNWTIRLRQKHNNFFNVAVELSLGPISMIIDSFFLDRL
jgi:carbon monoxide dehydrogenase subunit G